MLIEILSWDSNFFGFKVANVKNVDPEDEVQWFSALKQLQSMDVRLAYWIMPDYSQNFDSFAQKNNGTLVDIKTTYTCSLSKNDYQIIDRIEPYEEYYATEQLYNLSVQCGRYSRFAVDTNIPEEKFVELYRVWLYNSINKQLADKIYVYKIEDFIAGLATVKIKQGEGNIILIGVDEKFRGKGIGSELIKASKLFCIENNVGTLNVVTQGNNKNACRLYEKNNFVVKERVFLYHFWI
ncbi:MAG: GNAT family N-acetyltransferase [Bacteroidales bacterium]